VLFGGGSDGRIEGAVDAMTCSLRKLVACSRRLDVRSSLVLFYLWAFFKLVPALSAAVYPKGQDLLVL
jgi:hypothetical protein